MSDLLKYAGIALFARQVLGKAATNVQQNISYSFKDFKFHSFDLRTFTAKLKGALVITNNNVFPIALARFNGKLSLGQVSTNLVISQPIDIAPNQTVKAGFDIRVASDQFLDQLKNTAMSSSRPKLKIDGVALIGLSSNQTVDIRINTEIPIEIRIL